MILESSYSLLNQIGVLTLSLLVELGDFVHFIKFFYSVIVLSPKIYHPALKKTVFYFWLVPLIATRIGCRNRCVGLLVLHLLVSLDSLFIIKVYFVAVTVEDVCLNWQNWFLFLILVGSQLVIAINRHH